MTAGTTLLVDSREPWPHPWVPFLPDGWTVERATLDTGDIAVAANLHAVVERKTGPDFLAAIGRERSRFENELRRSRHLDAFAIVVEASLPDVLRLRGGLSVPAILGTIAAWSRRFCPVIFAGNTELAAEVALRFLHQPTDEARRFVAKVDRVHRAA